MERAGLCGERTRLCGVREGKMCWNEQVMRGKEKVVW